MSVSTANEDEFAVIDPATLSVSCYIQVGMDISGICADNHYVYAYHTYNSDNAASRIDVFDRSTWNKVSTTNITGVIEDIQSNPSNGNIYMLIGATLASYRNISGQLTCKKQYIDDWVGEIPSGCFTGKISIMPDGKSILLESGTILSSSADGTNDLQFEAKIPWSTTTCIDPVKNEVYVVSERLIQVYDSTNLKFKRVIPENQTTHYCMFSSGKLVIGQKDSGSILTFRELDPGIFLKTIKINGEAFSEFYPMHFTVDAGEVPNAQDSVSIDAQPFSSDASLTGNLGTVSLAVGANTFTITVNTDSRSQNYSLTITRRSSDPPPSTYNAFTNLGFTPQDVALDPERPIEYMTAVGGSSLYRVDLETGEIVKKDFGLIAEHITVQSGKVYLTLLRTGHHYYDTSNPYGFGAIAVIDTASFKTQSIINTDVDPYDIEADGTGNVFLSPGSNQWSIISSYNSTTGEYLSYSEMERYLSYIARNPVSGKIYSVDSDSFPTSMCAYQVSSGYFTGIYFPTAIDSDIPISPYMAITPDGNYIFNGSGNIFASKPKQAGDMAYQGTLANSFSSLCFDLNHNRFYIAKNKTLYAYIYYNRALFETISSSDDFINLQVNNGTVVALQKNGDDGYYIRKYLPDYIVTFVSQHGGTVDPVIAQFNSKIVAPTSLSCTGYSFEGWFTDSSYQNEWKFDSDEVTGDITLYAKWSINTYTVTFDSQDGGSVAGKVNVPYNSKISAPAVPIRTGYAFVGWYKQAECTELWNFSKDTVTDNITLWAKWTPNIYKVTFNSQGGSAVAAAYAQYDTVAPKPADPTRTGYTFTGWYRDATCVTAWDFDKDKVQAGTTLYAKWNINYYDVSFDSQGGGKVDAKPHIAYSSTFPAPLIPERTGYTFKGWYKEVACKHAWSFTKDKMPAGNVTLYAKWSTNTFAVSFNSQRGSAVKGKTAAYGALISAPSAPKRTGYTFGGWYKESGCTTAWDFSTDTVTAATTLWAKWTVNSYTVTFNPMGGTMTGLSSVPADFGTAIALPDAPIKDGFIFAGWYTSTKYATQWNFSTGKVTANMTLYAKWSLTAYTVTFNANGGAPNPDPQSVPYNGKATEPTPPAKAGCIFGGWYTSKTVFTAANQWDFGSKAVTGNVTLYARWITNLGTPAFTAVTAADDEITITFQPVPYAAHYCVSVYTGPDGNHYLNQLDSTSTTLTLSDADQGTVYWFKGWVYTVVGGKTVFGNTTGFVSEGPAQPETLKANATDYQTVRLTWGGTPYRSTGYEVWRATSSSGKYTIVSSPATPAFTDTVNTGTTYWYKVRAYRLNGTTKTYGAFSDAVSAQCILTDITNPTTVSAGTSSVTVSWDAVAGATMYEVWEAPADTGVFRLLVTTASTSYTQKNLVTGQPYYYKVRAYRLVGGKKVYGDFTDVMIATPAM